MSADPKARWERALAPNYGTPALTLTHGRGARVWDAAGREYLDFLAGLAVSSTGHAHPRVVDAVKRQAERLLHVSNLYATEENLALAERLTALTGYDRAFFCNSGAEANEFAIKLARRHAVRTLGLEDSVVVSFDKGFHGRTLATVTATGTPAYRKDFDPLPSGFVNLPFNDVAALEAVFESGKVAAVLMEFVQGEGGVRLADAEFARAVRRLCDAHGALMMADEVQTGVARTGKFLASEWFDVKPDVTTLAKGLASGVPIGACVYAERLAPLMAPGDHGCTFGGNPLSSAAALATLDVVQDEKLAENAHARGGELRLALAERVPGVADVRGLGLLNAVEFNADVAKRVRADAERAGLLVGAIGERVLRLAPPLVVTSDDVEAAVDVLAKAAAGAA